MEETTVIIGAGAAGLAAAQALAKAGATVTILEARDRPGGRIHTIKGCTNGFPIELGAEFVHGEQNETWEAIRAARLRTQSVPDRHWRARDGVLKEEPEFWHELSKVSERFNEAAPDQDFQSFLDHAWGLESGVKWLAKEYVEGFHAANARRVGIHALAKAEAAAERDKATRQFRLMEGYSALLGWFEEQLSPRRTPIHYNTVVKTIRWKPGEAQITAQTPAGLRRFDAARALVTVPLGVLQNRGPAAITFEPKLPAKEKAINSLAMGAVVKVTLEFRSRFWPVENFGFIHSDEACLPTWWSDDRGPILTGWAGGPRAEHLNSQGEAIILSIALRALSRLFKAEERRVRDLLVAGHTYDWQNDPFSCGAYSYTPVRMEAMPSALAAPVKGTLFFAGEATDSEGEQGTVQGALASGKRAASEILAADQGFALERRAA